MTLVYSTEVGRIKPEKEKVERSKGDGIVRIQRQTAGRKGKGVCVITGLDLDDKALNELGKALKKQGDKRDVIKQFLEQKNFTVKLSGG